MLVPNNLNPSSSFNLPYLFMQMGFKAESHLYSSPFRRCLQTTGILARSLNIDTIMVCEDELIKC